MYEFCLFEHAKPSASATALSLPLPASKRRDFSPNLVQLHRSHSSEDPNEVGKPDVALLRFLERPKVPAGRCRVVRCAVSSVRLAFVATSVDWSFCGTHQHWSQQRTACSIPLLEYQALNMWVLEYPFFHWLICIKMTLHVVNTDWLGQLECRLDCGVRGLSNPTGPHLLRVDHSGCDLPSARPVSPTVSVPTEGGDLGKDVY